MLILCFHVIQLIPMQSKWQACGCKVMVEILWGRLYWNLLNVTKLNANVRSLNLKPSDIGLWATWYVLWFFVKHGKLKWPGLTFYSIKGSNDSIQRAYSDTALLMNLVFSAYYLSYFERLSFLCSSTVIPFNSFRGLRIRNCCLRS